MTISIIDLSHSSLSPFFFLCLGRTAMQAASKSLFDTINEMYELEWTDRDVLVIQSQNLEMLWADFSQKLVEQVAAPLGHHMAQFPEYRVSVATLF